MPVIHELQHPPKVHLPVQMLHCLVNFRKHQEKADGLLFVKSKINQVLVDYRTQRTVQRLHLVAGNPVHPVHLQIPRLVIHFQQSVDGTLLADIAIRMYRIIGILQNAVRFPHHDFGQAFHHQVRPVGKLFEIIPETVFLEELDIVRLRIRHGIHRRLVKPVDQQAPPLYPLPEIHRSFHRLHAPRLQPLAATVKKHKGGFPVIDALEKAHLPHRIFIQPASLAVDKGGNAPHAFPFSVP